MISRLQIRLSAQFVNSKTASKPSYYRIVTDFTTNFPELTIPAIPTLKLRSHRQEHSLSAFAQFKMVKRSRIHTPRHLRGRIYCNSMDLPARARCVSNLAQYVVLWQPVDAQIVHPKSNIAVYLANVCIGKRSTSIFTRRKSEQRVVSSRGDAASEKRRRRRRRRFLCSVTRGSGFKP